MVRNDYKCSVCGKVLKIAGPRNIELHNKSKFHIAAMNQDNEIVPESKDTGIHTTVLEGTNEPNKETREQDGERNDDKETSGNNGDNDEWDGYLC